MIVIRIYKEKQFLIFDFEDGRTCRYNFATKTSVGIKGKPVKNLQHQLQGYNLEQLWDCFEDKNYARFLRYIQKVNSRYGMRNIGTILDNVPYYKNLEQIFSAGIEDIIYISDHDIDYTINDIPKSLIKIAKKHNIKISKRLISHYKINPNAHIIAYNLDYMTLNDDDIFHVMIGTPSYRKDEPGYFNRLITSYGYNGKALWRYLDRLKTLEALTDFDYIIREIYDYAKMMSAISDKYDKYPRNFLTTHKIACRNYNRLKKEFAEDVFKKRINKMYEVAYKDYIFLCPKCTQDIKDEAVMQNNCVASYIDKVINGECQILFLRKKSNPKQSLITIEVRNSRIVQALRKFNNPVTDEDQKAIDYFNNKFEKEKIAA
mgnify:CR=1 FL=1